MEKRIMRKHLFGTILVLAALAACNKEVETPDPAVDNSQPETETGKVTLTFKASISDETRTIYANDKTASWAAGDKISVCLTDSESYDVVDFTTEDGVTFSGEVNPGYTLPVSAIYPAKEVYTDYSWNSYFSQTDGSVMAVRLPEGYDLEDADDTGRFIPLIGTFDGENMSFHHFCSALKVTLTNIPADAQCFTFTTNNQKLAWDFSLSDGRMNLVNEEGPDKSVYFEFEPGSLTTRSFYIPIPDGTLAANSFVTLQNADGADLFKKRITSSPTFGLNANNKDAIRILPAVECWTRNENWDAYYYGGYIDNGTIKKRIRIENMTGSYQYEILTESVFDNTYGGSAADYFSSTHFSDRISGLTTSYSSNGLNLNYNTLPKGTYYVMLFGLDQDRQFTGEYNCVEVVNPTLSTPEGWSISVTERQSNYRISYTVPDETRWQYISVSANTFESTYFGNLEYLIYTFIRSDKDAYASNPSSWAPRIGSQAYSVNYGGDYILLSVGIDENYRPTGQYCLLNYFFETPTDAYNAWIGTWTVVDNGSTPNTDTWTITRKHANHTYTVRGLLGYDSSYSFEIKFNAGDGSLIFPSQIYNTSNTLTYWLVGSPSVAANHVSGEYDIMQASFNENSTDQATLVGLNSLKRYYTVSYKKSDGSYNGYHKVRYLPSSITRATE